MAKTPYEEYLEAEKVAARVGWDVTVDPIPGESDWVPLIDAAKSILELEDQDVD